MTFPKKNISSGLSLFTAYSPSRHVTDDVITPRLQKKNVFSIYFIEISNFSDAKDAGNILIIIIISFNSYNHLFMPFLISLFILFIFLMFRHVLESSGMFHFPGFIDGQTIVFKFSWEDCMFPKQ